MHEETRQRVSVVEKKQHDDLFERVLYTGQETEMK